MQDFLKKAFIVATPLQYVAGYGIGFLSEKMDNRFTGAIVDTIGTVIALGSFGLPTYYGFDIGGEAGLVVGFIYGVIGALSYMEGCERGSNTSFEMRIASRFRY